MFKKLKQTLENSVDAATSAVTSASGGRINLQKSPETQVSVQSCLPAITRLGRSLLTAHICHSVSVSSILSLV